MKQFWYFKKISFISLASQKMFTFKPEILFLLEWDENSKLLLLFIFLCISYFLFADSYYFIFCSSENHPVLDDVALHKIQGQICSELIVDLNHRIFIPQITFSGLYVAVSRVRRREDLQIMPIQPNSRNLIFLTTLQPPQNFVNVHGDWDLRCIQTD